MRTSILIVLAAGLPVALPASENSNSGIPANARFSRDVVVVAPGTIRTTLDGEALMQGGRFADWRIIAPDGRLLPVALLKPQAAGSRAATSIALNETADGWQILFDLGAQPGSHERLHLEPGRFVQAKDCLLEGSDDQQAWKKLTVGNLYSMGNTVNLHSAELSYPANPARYLRLSWPRAAEFPRFNSARVFSGRQEDEPVRVPIPVTTTTGPGRVRYEFSLPDQPMGATSESPYALRVRLVQFAIAIDTNSSRHEFKPSGQPSDAKSEPPQVPRVQLLDLSQKARQNGIALRIWRAQNGGWGFMTDVLFTNESQWTDGIRLDGHEFTGGDYRVEVYSDDKAPRLEAEYPPRWVVFKAESAGTYRLVYGAANPVSFEKLPVESLRGDMIDVTVRPAYEYSRAPLTSIALSPLPVPVRWNPQAAWTVSPPANIHAGDPVRLELPSTVLEAIKHDLHHLHLLAVRHPVPFQLQELATPSLVFEKDAVIFSPAKEQEQFEYSIDLSSLSGPRLRLELSTAAAHFDRNLTLSYETLARPGIEPPLREVRHIDWACTETGLAPCLLELPFDVPPGARRLIVRVDNSDNPALPPFDLRLWQPRAELRFGWPGEGGLILAWNPGDATGPFPAFYLVQDALLERPAAVATVDESKQSSPDSPWARHSRLALLTALTLAGAMLLWILAQMLKKPASVNPPANP